MTLTITKQQEQLQHRLNGSEQLIEQKLAKIEHYQANGGTAYVSVDPQLALNSAIAVDKNRASGFVPSSLAGLPVSIKDLFDVKGQVSTAGSVLFKSHTPAKIDAPVIQKLRQAGAVMIGRTNMSEFAFSGLGLNPHYGTPTYADNFTRIAGGSTSGGAVSVALGHAVAALGSDTGGSLRIPAAFCGLVGFKPSCGRITTTGAFPLSYSFDTVGAITRSVEDCALVDSILSGQEHTQSYSALNQLRFAITDDYVLDDADETVQQAYHSALDKLKASGAVIEKISFQELYDIPKINHAGGLTAAESWFIHRQYLQNAEQQPLYDPRVAKRITRGEVISAADYLAIQLARKNLIKQATGKLAQYDAWLYPTVAIVPPLLAPLEQSEELFFATNALALRNTTVMNFLNGCALSLPCHSPNQLPVGLSVAGLYNHDQKIIHISKLIERCLINL
ncbi:amidase [Neisseria sp. Ec49-e6-T10]|uniref:amidase n=1 Tax=Neisseria sp. Ec49-e6-T10 TaxID=3140744 RepID=UPI003EC091EE